MCEELIANPVIEDYDVRVEAASADGAPDGAAGRGATEAAASGEDGG
jgi:hypothetical protein